MVMLTITISVRTVIAAAILVLFPLLMYCATEASGSGQDSDAILQGDTDCDGDVDTSDALNNLRFVASLTVEQSEPCPDIGTLAAIPGPSGPQGPAGPEGQQGPPGLSALEIVSASTESDSTDEKSLITGCPQGKTIIGGGSAIEGSNTSGIALTLDGPNVDGGFWFSAAQEIVVTNFSWVLSAHLICAVVED
jgi:hypothetical protein